MSLFPFSLEYQQTLVLWETTLNNELLYAEDEITRTDYINSLPLVTQLFGELAFKDIIAIYHPKDFACNKSTTPLLVFTSLGLFCKSGAKYGWYMSFYSAELSDIRQEDGIFILPIRCSFSGRQRRIAAKNPMLLREIANIINKAKNNVVYWAHSKRINFSHALSYSVDRLPWKNLEDQIAYNTCLPSSTEKYFSLPENDYEQEVCIRYQNARFARGEKELFLILDKVHGRA